MLVLDDVIHVYYTGRMTNPSYTEFPELSAAVDSGELTTEQASNAVDAALVLGGFILWASVQPKYRDMFENNDEEHFIDGLKSSPQFTREFGNYLAGLAA